MPVISYNIDNTGFKSVTSNLTWKSTDIAGGTILKINVAGFCATVRLKGSLTLGF